MTYNIVLQKAHARTFNLIKKINEAKKLRDKDEEMKALMKQKSLDDSFSDVKEY